MRNWELHTGSKSTLRGRRRAWATIRLTVVFAQKAAFEATAAAMNLTCTFNMSVGPGGLVVDLTP